MNEENQSNPIPTLGKLTEALAKAQALIAPPKKTRKVDFVYEGKRTFYMYADLADVIACSVKALSDNGLCVTHQVIEREPNVFTLRTILLHTSGEFLESSFPIPDPLKGKPQGFASILTFWRRYAYCGLVGIAAEEDTDGGANTPPTEEKNQEKQKQKEPREQKRESTDRPTQPMLTRLYAIASTSGWTGSEVKELLKTKFGIVSSKDLSLKNYEELCKFLEENRKNVEGTSGARADLNANNELEGPHGNAALAPPTETPQVPSQNTGDATPKEAPAGASNSTPAKPARREPKSPAAADFIIYDSPELFGDLEGKALCEIETPLLQEFLKFLSRETGPGAAPKNVLKFLEVKKQIEKFFQVGRYAK